MPLYDTTMTVESTLNSAVSAPTPAHAEHKATKKATDVPPTATDTVDEFDVSVIDTTPIDRTEPEQQREDRIYNVRLRISARITLLVEEDTEEDVRDEMREHLTESFGFDVVESEQYQTTISVGEPVQ